MSLRLGKNVDGELRVSGRGGKDWVNTVFSNGNDREIAFLYDLEDRTAPCDSY